MAALYSMGGTLCVAAYRPINSFLVNCVSLVKKEFEE